MVFRGVVIGVILFLLTCGAEAILKTGVATGLAADGAVRCARRAGTLITEVTGVQAAETERCVATMAVAEAVAAVVLVAAFAPESVVIAHDVAAVSAGDAVPILEPDIG